MYVLQNFETKEKYENKPFMHNVQTTGVHEFLFENEEGGTKLLTVKWGRTESEYWVSEYSLEDTQCTTKFDKGGILSQITFDLDAFINKEGMFESELFDMLKPSQEDGHYYYCDPSYKLKHPLLK